jgi:hypothetical protein
MKNLRFLIAIVLLIFSGSLFAQHKSDRVKSIIESKHYTFVAQSALPTKGNFRNLTSEYDMRVNGDSLAVYLPYFGEAFAPVDPTENPLEFSTSTNKYVASQSKKGNWNITITPSGIHDARQFNLSVSSSGYGTLTVNFNNRQPISFNGFLRANHSLQK